MMDSLLSMDKGILIFIQNYLQNDMFTPFWVVLTNAGGIVLFLGIAGLLLTKKTRFCGVAALFSIGAEVFLSNGIIKTLIARPRPFDIYPDIIPLIGPPTNFSFPSGHTGFAFAAAFVMYRMLPRKYGVPALLLALLIAFSRLYLGVHYPSDVLFGILIGALTAETAVELTEKFMENSEMRRPRPVMVSVLRNVRAHLPSVHDLRKNRR